MMAPRPRKGHRKMTKKENALEALSRFHRCGYCGLIFIDEHGLDNHITRTHVHSTGGAYVTARFKFKCTDFEEESSVANQCIKSETLSQPVACIEGMSLACGDIKDESDVINEGRGCSDEEKLRQLHKQEEEEDIEGQPLEIVPVKIDIKQDFTPCAENGASFSKTEIEDKSHLDNVPGQADLSVNKITQLEVVKENDIQTDYHNTSQFTAIKVINFQASDPCKHSKSVKTEAKQILQLSAENDNDLPLSLQCTEVETEVQQHVEVHDGNEADLRSCGPWECSVEDQKGSQEFTSVKGTNLQTNGTSQFTAVKDPLQCASVGKSDSQMNAFQRRTVKQTDSQTITVKKTDVRSNTSRGTVAKMTNFTNQGVELRISHWENQNEYDRKICDKGGSDGHANVRHGTKPLNGKEMLIKQFMVTRNLGRHPRAKKHSCLLCGQMFPSRLSLESHQVLHSGEKPYMCSICSKLFRKKSTLECHMKIHSGDLPSFRCDSCGKIYSSKLGLHLHVKMHCAGTGEGGATGEDGATREGGTTGDDGATGEGGSTGDNGVTGDTEEKGYKCDACGKTFRLKKFLAGHFSVHTGEKPHECSTCGKKFRLLSTLRRHERMHLGEKPHQCPICGSFFSQRGALNSHMTWHSGARPYKCSVCAKTYSSKAYLNHHVRVQHEGDKPYGCSECGKRLTTKAGLDIHMRIHTGERPFGCSVCIRSFYSKGSRDYHETTHMAD